MSADEKIKAALEGLVAGDLDEEGGRRASVSDFCDRAGISRATLYRSAHAAEVRRLLAVPRGAASAPEMEKLQARVRELNEAEATSRSRQSALVRELRATVATYANQIQLLSLRLSQLEEDNRRLLASLASAACNVSALPRHS